MLDLFDAVTLAEEILDGSAYTTREITKTIRQLGQDDPTDSANEEIRSAAESFQAILDKPDEATSHAETARQLLEKAIELRKDQMVDEEVPALTATNG